MNAVPAMNRRAYANAWRYLTLAEARLLECNQCGDCCDSSRLPKGHLWGWGDLPADGYAQLNDGAPLIVPIEFVSADWRSVQRPEGFTSFRCTALEPRPDGTAGCGLHDRERPGTCGDFPVFSPKLEVMVNELRRGHVLRTALLERCAWWGIVILPERCSLLAWRAGPYIGQLPDYERGHLDAHHDERDCP